MHSSDASADTVVGGVLGLASGASSATGSAAPSTPRGGSSATGEPEGDFPNGGSHPRISAVQLAHDGRAAHEHDTHVLHTSGGGASASATASGSISTATVLQQLALSLNPNPAAAQVAEEGRGVYTLAGKPAAAHAAATLVNLAEVPANRQRMRDAGIAALVGLGIVRASDWGPWVCAWDSLALELHGMQHPPKISAWVCAWRWAPCIRDVLP